MARTTITGKVVAITGGARGIGKSTAEAFLAEGATVAIGDLDAELAEKTAAELGAAPGARIIGLPLNVADRASFTSFLDEVESQLGDLDVLVNNAGIMPTGVFLEEADSMTDRLNDVNIKGMQTGTKLAAKRFVPRGRGNIVNIASLAGVTPYPGLATYCGTKHFVLGFTDSVYAELNDSGVAVSSVLPAIVRTELSAGAKVPGWLENLTTVDPEEVAAGVVKAVRTGNPRVVVPGRTGAMLKTMSLLSVKARLRLSHWLKLDVTFTEADPAIRAKYHRRLTGGAE